MKIKKVLIANRGEIVLRIISTCREMGIETISIYSSEDASLPHAYGADYSFPLGEGSLKDTYLNQEKIIDLALTHRADAIHPGYGFLSENSEFAKKVEKAGLIFIGPSHEVIHLMGNKRVAKEAVKKIGVPCLPGIDWNESTTIEEVKKIGFPVLIKAEAGGGGKGMRLIRHEEEFFESLEAAQRESLKAFGDDKIIIEKFIEVPHHIEVQVFSDSHQNHLHLYERECSLQRRNQKILEESPSPAPFFQNLGSEIKEKLFNDAIKITKSINYRGAGTMEFLFDEMGNYYFLEMNTRLQVEHPVTEMVTDVDLVKWQILVAQGEKIPLKQSEIIQKGHSIEVRIYAENPEEEFLPTTGTLEYLNFPNYRYTRFECGFREGNSIGTSYDPMLAKLIVWGENRSSAIERLKVRLTELKIEGLVTNTGFLKSILGDEVFKVGDTPTNFIPHFFMRRENPQLENGDIQDWFDLVSDKGQNQKDLKFVKDQGPWEKLKGFQL
jgi:3-methylcrotonyl-CoA carboxylase alpha subunit